LLLDILEVLQGAMLTDSRRRTRISRVQETHNAAPQEVSFSVTIDLLCRRMPTTTYYSRRKTFHQHILRCCVMFDQGGTW
jgi:hypothetical protein